MCCTCTVLFVDLTSISTHCPHLLSFLLLIPLPPPPLLLILLFFFLPLFPFFFLFVYYYPLTLSLFIFLSPFLYLFLIEMTHSTSHHIPSHVAVRVTCAAVDVISHNKPSHSLTHSNYHPLSLGIYLILSHSITFYLSLYLIHSLFLSSVEVHTLDY